MSTKGNSIVIVICIPCSVECDMSIVILALILYVGEFSHDNDADYVSGFQQPKYILKEAQKIDRFANLSFQDDR